MAMNLTMPEIKGIPLQPSPTVGIPLSPPSQPPVVSPKPTVSSPSDVITIEEIGRRFKAKNTDNAFYASKSDAELGQALINKRPEYKALLGKPLAGVSTKPSPVTPQAQSPFDVVKQKGGITGFAGKALDVGVTGLGAVAGAVNKGYELYKKIPLVKLAGKTVGGAVGTLGGVLGSGIGTLGALATGKPILETAEKTAEATKSFGQQIGEEGAYAAPLGGLGRVANTALAASQIMGASETAKQALKTGDTAGLIEAGLQLGTGAIAGRGAMKNKGILLDKKVFREQMRSPYLEKVFAPEAEKIMAKREQVWSETLNLGAGEAKKIRKEALRGKERNVAKLFAQEEGLIIEEAPGKKISTIKASKEIQSRRDIVDAQLTNELQKDQTKWFSLNDAEEKAIKRIKESTGMLAAEKNAAISDIRNVFEQERQAAGVNKEMGQDLVLSGAEANEIKRGLYKYAYDEKGQPRQNAQQYQSTAEIIKSAIEDKYKKNADIAGINKKIGDYTVMEKALASIEGRTVRGGLLLRKLNQVIGGFIGGSIGGAPGAVAGVEVAGRLTDYLTNPERRISGLKKLGTLTTKESLLEKAQGSSMPIDYRKKSFIEQKNSSIKNK
jgi:hypothetical protein